MKTAFMAILLWCGIASGSEATSWQFNHTDAGWSITRNLQAIPSAEGLRLEVTGSYSHFANYALALEPSAGGTVAITYRAKGFPKATRGQLFFATEREPKLDERKKIPVPSLISDGQWHTLRIQVIHTAGGKKLWYDGGKITKLRVDLVNQFPGTVTIRSIKLEPSQDAEWRKRGIPESVTPTLGQALPPRKFTKFDPNAPYFSSPMAAPAGKSHLPGSVFVRREFELNHAVRHALLQIVADDQLEAVYVNGQQLRHTWSTDWRNADQAEITPWLRPGKNVLALQYRNHGAAGGVMFDLGLTLDDGRFELLTAEQARAVFGKAPQDWMQPEFDGHSFTPVAIQPGPPYAPWNSALPQYTDMRPLRGEVRTSGVTANGATLTVTFTGNPKLKADDKFYARIRSANGTVLAWQSGDADALKAQMLPDGSVRIRFNRFDLPRYGGELNGFWELGVYGRQRIAPEAPTPFFLAARPLPDRVPAVLKNVSTPHGPIAELNGKPFYFHILTVNSPDVATGMEGADSPFNVVAFRAGGLGHHWWLGPDQYDFTEIDRQLSQFVESYPNAKLGLYIWCQPGLWYEKRYPERISRQDNGTIMRYYVATTTFSDPDYRQDAAKAVAKLIEHCEKYFGSRMVLYHLMGGISCEWQGWSSHTTRLADYGKNAQRDFADFVRKRAPELTAGAAIPSREERLASDGQTLFRDPRQSRISMLYDTYYSESIADCVAQIAASAKKATGGKKLIGAYYGYQMEYANLGYCMQAGGHNALSNLLKSPDIDFLLSPNSYGIRALGAPNADMKPFATIAAHGKFSMLEDDTRTHLVPATGFSQSVNLRHTQMVLRRNLGMSLCRKMPLNQLPLTGGNDLNDPALRNDFQRALTAGQQVFERNLPRVSEIAVVLDEQSFQYLAPSLQKATEGDSDRFLYSAHGKLSNSVRQVQLLTGDLLYYQRIALGQIGAPVDYLLLDDLPRLAQQYKLIVFLNAFADSPALRQALSAAREHQAAILTVYGGGFMTGGGISEKNMSDLLNITFKRLPAGSLQVRCGTTTVGADYAVAPRFAVADPHVEPLATYQDGSGVAAARKGKNYFYGGATLSDHFLRQVARDAGVHLYLETGDNLEIGNGILSIHSKSKGIKKIQLRAPGRLTEVFTGETIDVPTGRLELPMAAFDTKVFRIQ